MHIRLATPHDLDDIADCYERARGFMQAHGNATQWSDGYPSRSTAERDIAVGCCYVCEGGNGVLGCLTLLDGPDPSYGSIGGGSWLNDKPYKVVHRIAARVQGTGVGGACMSWACSWGCDVRADTHEDNLPMQGLLEGLGFVRCGTVHLPDGGARLAYHWTTGDRSGDDRGSGAREDDPGLGLPIPVSVTRSERFFEK